MKHFVLFIPQTNKLYINFREEWQWVQDLGSNTNSSPTPAQAVWQHQLSEAAQKLVRQLGVSGEHRLYSGEVLDLSGDVSLILIFPPLDALFCSPGKEDELLSKPDILALPIHTFEMIHMSTYQSQLLGRYARLNCILEMDKLVAEHAKREAFSQDEIDATKQRLAQVHSFQEYLEESWIQLRWVKDAISFARDKSSLGVPLSAITNSNNNNSSAIPRSRPNSFNHKLSDSSSPSASPPLQPHHTSTDSVLLGADQKRFCKSDKTSSRHVNNGNITKIKKSSTAENVRVTPKADINFVKSKTSECLYRSHNHDLSPEFQVKPLGMPAFLKHTEPLPWDLKGSNWDQNSMYIKDKPITRSEYRLQDSIEPLSPLPRKASAPSYLDGSGSTLHPPTEQKLVAQDSPTLEAFQDPSMARKRKETMIESREAAIKILTTVRSPSSSCHDINQHLGGSSNFDFQRTGSSLSHESEISFANASLKSLSSTETEIDTVSLVSRDSGRSETSDPKSGAEGDEMECSSSRKVEETAIIQVSPAYNTGMSSRVAVKLKINHKTSARDVIDLVVKQLNINVIVKGKKGPTYGNDKLGSFCFVTIINKRERCLRDDFRLLSLQEPWKHGEHYVRFKHETLAALELSAARQLSHQQRQSGSSSSQSGSSSSQSGSFSSQSGSSHRSGTESSANSLSSVYSTEPPGDDNAL